ncbi:LANO_0F08988g1_1 [Lachancea nothofagi CBS 11611]|uniref:LANO_0F08988g1_1 n=1 Tax=Lachancea nothofagi CBS 11611 TaxID=1266666 RepID=A0A1G4K9T4_9SACH|nr:LANO_0F08988g1_1 [Lachancea nothofagi CBS 11611]
MAARNPPSTFPAKPTQSMFTCKSCRQRKRRCSREKPRCGRCIRLNIPCVYELPPKHLIRRSTNGEILAPPNPDLSIETTTPPPQILPLSVPLPQQIKPLSLSETPQIPLVSVNSIDTDTTVANHPIKAHFHTTLDLNSHIVKDPFFLEFAVSATVCGPQLARDLNSNHIGHLWFGLSLGCHHLLELLFVDPPAQQPQTRPFGTNKPRNSSIAFQECTELLKDIASALPSMQAIETYKVQFYQNVYTAVPVLNIQAFERSFQNFVIEAPDGSAKLNTDPANPWAKLSHLVILLMAIRMGNVCLCLYNERIEQDAAHRQQTEAWLCQNPVSRDVLILIKRCLELLNIYDNPTEDILCCMIYLRSNLLLEGTDMWSALGVSNAEMLEATVYLGFKMNLFNNVIGNTKENEFQTNVTVQEKLYRRKLWLSICSTSLHEHTLRGGNSFVKANQLRQFSDHYRVFDDYRAISLRELPSDDQIELDYHIMLLKNHQFMEVLCDIEESHQSNDEFLEDKVHENERLALFFKDGFPDADPSYKIDMSLPLYLLCNSGQIPVRIGSVKQIAVFQTRFALLIKQLSNSSLLMFYYEKEYKHSKQPESFSGFEHHLIDSMKIVFQLFEYYKDYAFGRLAEVTPSAMRYILANTMTPIFNRVILVTHGIMLRFLFLLEVATFDNQTEKIEVLKRILSALRSFLLVTSDCMKMEFLAPRASDANQFFVKLFDLGNVRSSIKSYSTLKPAELVMHKDAIRICKPGYSDYYSNAVRQLSIASLRKILELMDEVSFTKRSGSPVNFMDSL